MNPGPKQLHHSDEDWETNALCGGHTLGYSYHAPPPRDSSVWGDPASISGRVMLNGLTMQGCPDAGPRLYIVSLLKWPHTVERSVVWPNWLRVREFRGGLLEKVDGKWGRVLRKGRTGGGKQVFQVTGKIPVLDPWGMRGVNLTLLWGGWVMK